MCLIVLKPKGANNSFTKEKFDNALIANPHGIGIAYSDGGKLQIEKFDKPQDIADEIYKKIADKDAYLIHFRYATHGKKDVENVHPFLITEGLCVAHNGVISKYPEINKDWSDTRNYVEGILKPYIKEHGKDSFKSPEFIKEVEEGIGAGSKMVFVNENMDYSIANEKAGTWIDGCWYSNTYSIEEFNSRRKWASYKKDNPQKELFKYDDYKGKSGKYGYDDYDYGYGYGYDDYGYGYGDYDYDNYDDTWEYLKGSMSMDEINKFIADEIDNGYTEGEQIPFELDIDYDALDNLSSSGDERVDDYDFPQNEIAKQVRRGVYKGMQPVQWELTVDKKVIDHLLKKDDQMELQLNK